MPNIKNEHITSKMTISFPTKPTKAENETEEQFSKKLLEFAELKRIYAREYNKLKLSLETLEEKEARKRKARCDDDPEKRAIYLEKERLRYVARIEERKVYKNNNPETIKSIKKRYYLKTRATKELIDKYNSSRRKNHNVRKIKDIQYVTKRALRASLNNNVRYYLNGWKSDSIKNLIGCTIEEFIKHIEDQFQPGMTWLNRNFHLDHIKPCSSFDLTDEKQRKECFHYTNYQPLWPEENLEKNARLDWKRKSLTECNSSDRLQHQPHYVAENKKD